MHFVRGHVGGRRLRERGGVDRVAARHRPHPGFLARGLAQRFDQRDLAVERGIDFGLDDLRRARAASRREFFSPGAPHQRLHQAAFAPRAARSFCHLRQRQVEREIGRDPALLRLDPLALAVVVELRVELRAAGRDRPPRRPAVCIGWAEFEEIGHAEIGAALLDEHVGLLRDCRARIARGRDLLLDAVEHDLAVELALRRQLRGIDRGDRRRRAASALARSFASAP